MMKATATTTFQARIATAREKLAALEAELVKLEQQQAAKPRDYGFAGSAGYVADQLNQTLMFLRGEE
jgi:hypothetical protein